MPLLTELWACSTEGETEPMEHPFKYYYHKRRKKLKRRTDNGHECRECVTKIPFETFYSKFPFFSKLLTWEVYLGGALKRYNENKAQTSILSKTIHRKTSKQNMLA